VDTHGLVRAALITTAVAAAAATGGTGSAGIPPRAPSVITQSQSGKTYRVARGTSLALRLSGQWQWTEPRPTPQRVELTPVEYFVDPGYSEWKLDAHTRGTVTITSTGTPGCDQCALAARRFVVTLRIL